MMEDSQAFSDWVREVQHSGQPEIDQLKAVKKLAEELMDAHRREGHAISQRENTLRMAEASKAFAHFAW